MTNSESLFAAQPPEGTGGFTVEILLQLAADTGLTGSDFAAGVREGRYEKWVLWQEATYRDQDPQGTPAAWLDGRPLNPNILFDRAAFENKLRA